MDPNGGEGIGNLAYGSFIPNESHSPMLQYFLALIHISYITGFKNCNAIRDRKAVVGDSAVENTPQNNADTFAIFASGMFNPSAQHSSLSPAFQITPSFIQS